MDKTYTILAINPGPTSTKIALFRGPEPVFSKTLAHSREALAGFAGIDDQLYYRKEMVEEALKASGVSFSEIDAYAGRGGGLVPISGGTYIIDETLLSHARKGLSGKHPAQLAAQICDMFAKEHGGAAFVVNPPDVDEYCELARVTGLRGVYRESHIHTLNQKEVALRYCAEHGLGYDKCDLIICHIGGGVSVTAHHLGRMVDSNDIMAGDGPMAPTRSGALPAVELVKMAFSGRYTETRLRDRIYKTGGLLDHLGTADSIEIERRIEAGDSYAALIYDAMIYQIAKQIGACACVLMGRAAAVILTGGLAKSRYLVKKLTEYAGWIAPVAVLAGEFEMEALAAGVRRVLTGGEKALSYTGKPCWPGFGVE